MNNILYREINLNELNNNLFAKFNRYQEVKKCWRKIDGKWALKDISFVEQWNNKDIDYLVKCLINTIKKGGCVYAAFDNGYLAGFSSVENEIFGDKNKYLQLSCIHTSFESRGLGIGKKLFYIMAEEAKKRNAQKLYISAHSSEESQAFYKRLGCKEAEEYNEKLVEQETCDCQLEYELLDEFYCANEKIND